MKKIPIWLVLPALICTVFLMSCRKKDQPDPSTIWPGPAALLDSRTTNHKGQITVDRFEFNKDSGLTKYDQITDGKYYYSEFYFYDNNQPKHVSQIALSITGKLEDAFLIRKCYYNSNGLLVTMKDNKSDSISFVYNNNKQLIGRYSYSNDSIYDANVITWSGANIVKLKTTWYNTGDSKHPSVFDYTFKYDNKRNPYTCVPYFSTINFGVGFTAMSANNIIEMTEVSENGTHTYKYSYQYKDQGYPVSYTGDDLSIQYAYQK